MTRKHHLVHWFAFFALMLNLIGPLVPAASFAQDATPEVHSISEQEVPPADTDGDGVTDDIDECVDVAGPAENNGCPLPPADTDGDGVTDDIDECVDIAGPAENNGCPLPPADTDGDGVTDDSDECVDVAGPAENNGCPLIPMATA